MAEHYTEARLRRAQKELELLEKEKVLAKDILKIEGQVTIAKAQIQAMEDVQQKLVSSEVKGIKDGIKKILPGLMEARHQTGISGISGYLDSVKERAKQQ